MKIAFFDTKPYDLPAFKNQAALFGMEIEFFETKLNAATAALANGFDAVCIFVNDCADAETIDALYKGGVKVIALRCAGYNNVDLSAAFGKIHVFRVPAYSPYAVAEHAMAMLLTSIRRIHKAYNRTKDFNFSLGGLTGYELHGKTAGIVGTGKIGRIFADICKGFGMKVLCYDKYPCTDCGYEYVDADTLMRESDVISLHCPLTEETHHIIDANAISLMKKGVAIINTSRGALIDADALLAGIKERKIGTACLDVYEEESDIFFEDYSGHIIDDDTLARLITMPNVLVTSHQAFLTDEALGNIAETTINNVNEYFTHGFCENELCYRCGKTADCQKKRAQKCF